ncbi:hypothetical protein HZ326_25562 [Fusarium oxysporum f. sp. albedinis]|nr:hypothetical protein HZ326_25562 [Fusarium oxysporum f. sp. albedinis]
MAPASSSTLPSLSRKNPNNGTTLRRSRSSKICTCGEPDDASSIIPTKNIIQIILKLSMGSQSISAEALNAYDDQRFIREDNSCREHEYGRSAAINGGINQGGDVSSVMSRFCNSKYCWDFYHSDPTGALTQSRGYDGAFYRKGS